MIKFRLANIEDELAKLKVFEGRKPQTAEFEIKGVFAILGASHCGG